MGIFGREARHQIARPDSGKGQIVFKWPEEDLPKLSHLTVEQDELAVFLRDGRVQGTIQPGRVTLDSSEVPFLGRLASAGVGGDLFRSELYFVSTREFANLPFGGAIDNVVDPQTNLEVGLRVFGEYSVKVVEPESFIVKLVGGQERRSNEQILDWVRGQLLLSLRTDVVPHIVSLGRPLVELAERTDEIEQQTIVSGQRYIADYGLQIARLSAFAITLKPEDEDRLRGIEDVVQGAER